MPFSFRFLGLPAPALSLSPTIAHGPFPVAGIEPWFQQQTIRDVFLANVSLQECGTLKYHPVEHPPRDSIVMYTPSLPIRTAFQQCHHYVRLIRSDEVERVANKHRHSEQAYPLLPLRCFIFSLSFCLFHPVCYLFRRAAHDGKASLQFLPCAGHHAEAIVRINGLLFAYFTFFVFYSTATLSHVDGKETGGHAEEPDRHRARVCLDVLFFFALRLRRSSHARSSVFSQCVCFISMSSYLPVIHILWQHVNVPACAQMSFHSNVSWAYV